MHMGVEIPAHVRTTSDAGGAVLLDLERGVYLSLNGSGAAIWDGLRDGREPEQIAASLAARYGKPLTDIMVDVTKFLRELETRGLVRVST